MTTAILGLNIHTTTYQSAIGSILRWSRAGDSRSIYAANVHMVLEAYDSPQLQRMVNSADMVTPDGMPLVWIMRRKGYPHQERVYGPTLMLKLLDAAANEGIPVGFLGSTKDIIQELNAKMTLKFPGLIVGTQIAPPFRPLTTDEDQVLNREINDSGIKILFVGLGCPKQEIWIAEHRDRIKAVMIGVGAAFAFHAGMVRQAPFWIQKLGFEWLFRFSQEPCRLWRRYILGNPRFMFLIMRELWLDKLSRDRG